MEIELYSKMNDPMAAIERIGQFFAKSNMFGCDRQEQGQVLALICMTEKKSPVEIMRVYHIVEGKLAKKALAALAEFNQKGGKHKWIKSGDEATARPEDRAAWLELIDSAGNKIDYRYSMADATAEGLVRSGSRWTKRPGNMLRARCISNGLGMLCPEIFAGADDSDSDGIPASAPEIKLAAPEPQSNIINIESTKVEEPKTGPVTSADVKAEPEPEKPFAQGPAYAVPMNGAKLSDELVGQVETAIGEHAIAAGIWMIKEGWLQKGQNLTDLPEARARRILKQRDSFIKVVTAGAK